MSAGIRRMLSILCVLTLLMGAFPLSAAAAPTLNATGWFETLCAELSGVTDAQVTAVSYSGPMSGSLEGEDFDYLVRDMTGGVRIDIPGLKPGTYTLRVTAGGSDYTAEGVKVLEHDRSGYAHWNYTSGVGAYKDDGTLKDNAKVIYVTEANKDTVSITSKDGTTVKGIGNILNSGGRAGSSKGKANTNAEIIKKLSTDGTPLVVRIIGDVTTPAGVTAKASVDYGGSTSDNGGMCRMQGGKDITIEGIGSDAQVNGWGFHFICQTGDYKAGRGRSFEIRNLSFRNVPEDCVGIEGTGDTMGAPVERTWVHNCAFYVPKISNPAESDKGEGDGACDFKRGQYHTMSYCYYEGYHKTNLVGSDDPVQQYNMTWHHNYWKNCDQRGPLGRQANMHIYNCLYEGQRGYCMSLRADVYIFSEYNSFQSCKNPVQDEKSGGVCKSYMDDFVGCSGNQNQKTVSSRSQTVSSSNKNAGFEMDAAKSYIPSGNYKLDESTAAAKEMVLAYAGPMKAMPSIVIPDTHQHSWSDWKVVQQATCTQKGQESRTCSAEGCDSPIQTQDIPALGHNYVGNQCTRCGDKITGKVYTLTGSEVYAGVKDGTAPITGMVLGGNANKPDSYNAASNATTSAGTEDFFTLLFTKNSRLDPDERTFDDGYAATHQINFQGAVTTDANAVCFETQGPAVVQAWWVGAVATSEITDTKQPRPMVILDKTGKEAVEPSAVSDNNVDTMITTFVLPDAGTYYLGGKGGKNFIHKVTVTMGGTQDPDPVCQHANKELRGAKAATCTAEGYTGDTYCKDCGEKLAEGSIIAKTSHSFSGWSVTKAPTCTAVGQETRSCTVCGAKESRELATVDHQWDAGVVTTPATCLEKGLRTFTCVVGKETRTEEIPAKGHTPSADGKTCTVCKADLTAGIHTCDGQWKTTLAPTCTAAGKETKTCSICGATQERTLAALGHRMVEVTGSAKAPTCTAAGKEADKKCERCSLVETGAAIAAKGHSWAGDVCAVCGEKKPDGGDKPVEPDKPVAVTGVKVTGSATVKEKASTTLTVTVTPSNAANKQVYWVSADTRIATVDRNTGLITGVKEGRTIITVTTVDGGFTAMCNLSVTSSSSSGGGGGGGGGGGSSKPSGGSGGGGGTAPTPTPTPTPSTGMAFVDVKAEDWFCANVKRAFEQGLMKGTDATHFAPNANTTRATIATVLFRLDGEKKGGVQAAFTDVASGVWYTDAVAWASEKGIVKGYDDTTFAPDDNVTREQLAVMLYRYAAPAEKPAKGLDGFADADCVSAWAAEAMAWAVEMGIITGKGAGNLDPQGLATRAEICTMLVRFLDLEV